MTAVDLREAPAPPPLDDATLRTFSELGYLLVKGVVPPEEASRLARAVLDLVPRDLSVPEAWSAHAGRLKPYRRLADGSRDDCIDTPELLTLYGNERLYAVAAQLLGSPRLRIFDGSVGITMRNLATPEEPRSQRLHIDASVPKEVDQFLCTPEELQIGGCLYLTDVLPDGGGIHVVPGGHRYVEEESRRHPGGRHLHAEWKQIPDRESVEVTGSAGDFAVLHHLMPHAASHNRRSEPRLAVFLRYVREDHSHGYGRRPARSYGDAQLTAIGPLARRLLGLEPWPG